jgi:hypothetical protein
MEKLLDRIIATAEWSPLVAPKDTDQPYATHEAWITVGEDSLHVYQLNTGQRIIEKASVEALLGGALSLWLAFLVQQPQWDPDVRLAPAGWESIAPGELVATTEATKAFASWAVEHGLAKHPERLRGYLDHLDYLSAVDRQGHH